MKTTTIALGTLCLLAICAVPLAAADVTVGECSDSTHCASRTVSTGAARCTEWETPFSGSVVDKPSCQLNQ